MQLSITKALLLKSTIIEQYLICSGVFIDVTGGSRAVLGEYRPSVFLYRSHGLGLKCQDFGPIFSQYSSHTWFMRYIELVV